MTWRHIAFWFLISGIMYTDIGACSGPNVTKKALLSSEPSEVLSQILEEPTRYESEILTIAGKFQGWKGPCQGGPPVSRSDWMIVGPSGCLYVNGPVPAGLNPAKPSGEMITVTGVVRLKKGVPYLELLK
ncbi:MAG: hypothetical protein JW932_07095 [Deltaproteobacteria bacterium]|nr:hypothetical protein [Deltaproteobacteria bacterium]